MADLNREADSSHVHYHGRSPRLALCRFLSTAVAGGGARGGKDHSDVVAIHGVRVSREPAMVVAKDGSRNYTRCQWPWRRRRPTRRSVREEQRERAGNFTNIQCKVILPVSTANQTQAGHTQATASHRTKHR